MKENSYHLLIPYSLDTVLVCFIHFYVLLTITLWGRAILSQFYLWGISEIGQRRMMAGELGFELRPHQFWSPLCSPNQTQVWGPRRLPAAQSSGIPFYFGTKHNLCVGFQDGLSKNCPALPISPAETDGGRLLCSTPKLLEEIRNFLALSCSMWGSQIRLYLNLNLRVNWCFLVVVPETRPRLVLCDLTCCCSELDT